MTLEKYTPEDVGLFRMPDREETNPSQSTLPRIERNVDAQLEAELDVKHYEFFLNAGQAELVRDSNGQPIGVRAGRPREISSLERSMIEDCDTLAGIFDGSITKSSDAKHSPFLEGAARYPKPVEAAIYLDKSARPVAALMHELMSALSDSPLPETYFANIDKIPYLKLMGFAKGENNLESVDQEAISLDMIDPGIRRDLKLRLRAMYLLPKDRDMILTPELLQFINSNIVPIDQPHPLQAVEKMCTKLTGKHVAIIDEVRSSGSTLRIADMLYREAMPDVEIEPVYWSVPNLLYWNNGREFVAREVPPWYTAEHNRGRGGIEDVDVDRNKQAANPIQQVGAPFLSSTPIDNNDRRRKVDWESHAVRHDIKLLANRFRAGLARYMPSRHRTESEQEERLLNYLGDKYISPDEV